MDEPNVLWGKFNVQDLKSKLKERALPTTGLKADMVTRLEKYDQDHRPAPPLPRPHTSDNRRYVFDERRNRDDERSRQNPNTSPLDHPRIPSNGGTYERGRETYGRERERARAPSPSPARSRSRRRRSDWDHYSPNADNASLTESNLKEAELEAICFENFSRMVDDPKGFQRRAKTRAEFDVKAGELKTKKEATIERIEKKYQKEMAGLEKERDAQFDELDEEIRPFLERERNWNPAFGQLKHLRAARGLETWPNDFDPDRLRNRRPRIPASNISDSAATATAFSHTSPATRSLRHRLSESTPAIPTSSETPNKRRPQETPTSDFLKRKIDEFTPAASSSETSSKRVRNSSDYIQTKSGPIPTRPLAETNIENTPIYPTIRSSTPYIFLPEACVKVYGDYLESMRVMISKRGYDFKAVRADDTGYFITFEDSDKGKNDAMKMHNWYDKEMFKGKVMHLQIYNYE